jgi:hypothetical protein
MSPSKEKSTDSHLAEIEKANAFGIKVRDYSYFLYDILFYTPEVAALIRKASQEKETTEIEKEDQRLWEKVYAIPLEERAPYRVEGGTLMSRMWQWGGYYQHAVENKNVEQQREYEAELKNFRKDLEAFLEMDYPRELVVHLRDGKLVLDTLNEPLDKEIILQKWNEVAAQAPF